MSPGVRVMERLTRVAPFGVRFWDPLTQTAVAEGLRVVLHPAGQPGRGVTTRTNGSGVHVLHDAPGLARAAWGEGDEAYWSHPPQTAQYRGEVSDLLGRFHPVSFAVQLPFRGLFLPACAAQSPPGPAGGIELFSTASRALPGALAVVRAELSSMVLGAPAAWALLTAEYRGEVLGRGVADRQGRVVLAFPFPEPERRPRRSPPETASPPAESATLMQWEVQLRVHFSALLASQPVPDYCDLLSQPPARLLVHTSPPEELAATAIALGQEFVYPAPRVSRLFVAPA